MVVEEEEGEEENMNLSMAMSPSLAPMSTKTGKGKWRVGKRKNICLLGCLTVLLGVVAADERDGLPGGGLKVQLKIKCFKALFTCGEAVRS